MNKQDVNYDVAVHISSTLTPPNKGADSANLHFQCAQTTVGGTLPACL